MDRDFMDYNMQPNMMPPNMNNSMDFNEFI